MLSFQSLSFSSRTESGGDRSFETPGKAQNAESGFASDTPSKEAFNVIMSQQSAMTEAFDPETITKTPTDLRAQQSETETDIKNALSHAKHLPGLSLEIEDVARVNPAAKIEPPAQAFQADARAKPVLVDAPDDLAGLFPTVGETTHVATGDFRPETFVEPILVSAPEALLERSPSTETPATSLQAEYLRAMETLQPQKRVDPILVISPKEVTEFTPNRDIATTTPQSDNLVPINSFSPGKPIESVLSVAPEGLFKPSNSKSVPPNSLTIETLKFLQNTAPTSGGILETDAMPNTLTNAPSQTDTLTNLSKVEPILVPSGRLNMASLHTENAAAPLTSTTGTLSLSSMPIVTAPPQVQTFAPTPFAPAQIVTAQTTQIGQIIVEASLQQERTIIRIDPPELGRIQLDFDHSTSGRTSIILSAETEAARQILADKRAFMMTLFEGYGLDDVDIKIQRQDSSGFSKQEGSLNFSERQNQSRSEFDARQINNSSEQSQNQVEASERPFSQYNNRREIGAERLHIRV